MKMIEGAEQAGLIKPGATLVEGTAGNTGLGLALVTAQKGYQLTLITPEPEQHGNLCDLIARPFETNDTITVSPDEPLANAYSRMKLTSLLVGILSTHHSNCNIQVIASLSSIASTYLHNRTLFRRSVWAI